MFTEGARIRSSEALVKDSPTSQRQIGLTAYNASMLLTEGSQKKSKAENVPGWRHKPEHQALK